MSLSPDRIGNFTSSEIYNLTTVDPSGKNFGKPALTYIEECNIERRLGRPIERDTTARALSWGKLNERRVHDLLGLDYRLCSSETLVHPDIDFWVGSPDFIHYCEEGNTVSETKCPITMKSFCRLVDAMHNGGIDSVREVVNGSKNVGEQYFWQIVSNAELTQCAHGELIVYCPYQSELEAIRDMAMHWDGPDQKDYQWIAYASDDELPYLVEGGYYKNINKLRFPILPAYRQHLKGLVLKAGELLVPRQQLVTC